MLTQFQWLNVANQQRTVIATANIITEQELKNWMDTILATHTPPCDHCILAISTEYHDSFIKDVEKDTPPL